MQELRDKEAEDRQRAQLIEASLEEIDALLQLVRASREKSMDWQELTRLIVEAAKQGDPLASMVHSLDPNPTPNPHASPSPSPFTLTLTLHRHRSPLTAHRSPLTSHLSPSPSPSPPPPPSPFTLIRDVLGPLGDIIGPDVDYLYTKVVR